MKLEGKNKSETLEKKENHLFLLHVLGFFLAQSGKTHTAGGGWGHGLC